MMILMLVKSTKVKARISQNRTLVRLMPFYKFIRKDLRNLLIQKVMMVVFILKNKIANQGKEE